MELVRIIVLHVVIVPLAIVALGIMTFIMIVSMVTGLTKKNPDPEKELRQRYYGKR